MDNLKEYHLSWLSRHPEYDEVWLCDKLANGFDIHHLDGDHENSNPMNLILMECRDHMTLHGQPTFARMLNAPQSPAKRYRKAPKGIEIDIDRELSALGMSRPEFAYACGTTRGTLYKWMNAGFPWYAYQILRLLRGDGLR